MTEAEATSVHAGRAALLRRLYASFNAREIDEVLTTFAPDVDWPNVAERARVVGHDAVREYWRRQFERIDPHVEPTGFTAHGDALIVAVHQIVRDRDGEVLNDVHIAHAYTFRDDLILTMNVYASVEEALG